MTFRSKRVERSYVWKPYTTIMPEDKIALMSGIPGYVPAKINSPWGNKYTPDHQLRFTIEGPEGYLI
jgi:hypothetical protein